MILYFFLFVKQFKRKNRAKPCSPFLVSQCKLLYFNPYLPESLEEHHKEHPPCETIFMIPYIFLFVKQFKRKDRAKPCLTLFWFHNINLRISTRIPWIAKGTFQRASTLEDMDIISRNIEKFNVLRFYKIHERRDRIICP